MASEVDTELELLRSFANTSLRKGSFIYEKVNDLLTQAAREKARLMVAAASTPPSDVITVRLRINIAGINEIRSIEIKKGSTMESLKRNIEAITGTGYSTDRVQSKRTGKAWGTFDSKSIEQCEIKHNDELVVDCKNLNENLNPTGLERIRISNLTPQSTFQLVTLALHAFTLDEEFITVTELPNSTPGFAPSLKELPKGTFLPNNWNANPNTVAVMYKHKSKPGKQFQLMMVEIDATTTMVTFAQKGGESHSREISHSQFETSFQSCYAAKTGDVAAVADLQSLKEGIVQPLVYALLPSLLAVKQAAATAATAASAMEVSPSSSSSTTSAVIGTDTYPRSSAPRTEPPSALGGRGGSLGPLSGGYPRPSPGSIGSGDLDPFPGGVRIGGSGSYGPGGFAGPDGGNWVGPNHPMFDPNGGFGTGGGEFGGGYGGGYGESGYGGRGLPQPRFDPFGPVIGPNTDIGGAGTGDVGVDSRGRRIPQIPGPLGQQPRGPPGRARVPGEPQPDHLRPPGW